MDGLDQVTLLLLLILMVVAILFPLTDRRTSSCEQRDQERDDRQDHASKRR
ncbi:hypothetical protein [Herbaspirillum rubrisubalbicans]|uniref:hypothetical protein n=1 Tax=Herbaspirillum rubrisubalbicans TaxID=80842 RepID=UPI0015C56E44|nr:hypothetical protein [Herbaspirillum rubrisubalbicans]